METNVLLKINGLDNSKAAFASLSKNLEKVQDGTRGLRGKLEDMEPVFKKMSVAGGLAFAGMVVAAQKSVDAYAEVERAQRQLTNAVIGVSKGTQEQVAQINALTAALEKKAGVDADALNMGVAQLSTFGLSTDAVIKLTKSLADLTVNQDGLNAGSEQYISNANVIAKALNGQFGILEKSGIRFTEAQKAIIELGTESEKVAAINEGLAQNLRETTDTVNGLDLASAKHARTMENLSENLGKSLAPAFLELAAKVTPIVEKFAAWAEANPELLAKIVLVTGAVVGLIAVIGTLGLILPPIIAGFSILAGVIGAISLPIVLVVAAIAAVGAAIYLLWKNWDTVTAFLADNASKVWGAITDTFKRATSAISDAVGAMWEGIKGFFTTYINFIVGIFATLLDFLAPGWDEALKQVFATVQEVLPKIAAFIGEVLAQFTAILSEWFAIYNGVWLKVWETLSAVFTEVWQAIKAVFDTVIEGITAGMESLVKPIQKVIDLAKKALDLAKQAGAGIKTSVTTTIDNIISRGDSITPFANGGIVTGPTLGLVGEAGPEAIIPLSKAAGFGGITINVTGNTFFDQNAAVRMGDLIVKKLQMSRQT